MDRATLKAVFLGKMTRWPDRTRIRVGFLKGQPVSRLFLRDVLKKTEHQYQNLWNQAIFTGQGLPPKWFSDKRSLVLFVKNQPGAIGFLFHKDIPPDLVSEVLVFQVEDGDEALVGQPR